MRLLKSFQSPTTYGSRLTGIRSFTDPSDATISTISPFTNARDAIQGCSPMQGRCSPMQECFANPRLQG